MSKNLFSGNFVFERETNGVLLPFPLQIVLDNRAHSGKVKIHLENQAKIKECKDTSVSGQGENLIVKR